MKYIKISKYTQEGVDQTSKLRITSRIVIPTASQNYTVEVKARREYSEYFLFEVETPVDFLPGDNTRDYRTLAGRVEGAYKTLTAGTVESINELDIYEGNIYSTFQGGGIWRFPLLSNTRIDTTVSTNYVVDFTTDLTASFALVKNYMESTEEVLYEVSKPTGLGGEIKTLSFSGSFYSKPSDAVCLVASVTGSATGPGDYVYFQNLVWDNISAKPVGGATYLPYTVDIEKEVETEEYLSPITPKQVQLASRNKYEVDYGHQTQDAVNYQAIMTGSAKHAEVQDFLEQSEGLKAARYTGTKVIAQKLNSFTEGDQGTYGKLPAFEKKSTVAATFTSVENCGAEKYGAVNVFIDKVILEDGTVLQSLLDMEGYYSLQDGLSQGTGCEFTFKSSGSQGGPSELGGTKQIIRSGYKIEPILYTVPGVPANQASSNTYPSLSFNYYSSPYSTALTSSTDFTFLNRKDNSNYTEVSSSKVPITGLTTVVYPGGSGQPRMTGSLGVFNFNPSDQVTTPVTFKGTVLITNFSQNTQPVVLRVEENKGTGYTQKAATGVVLQPNDTDILVTVDTGFFYPSSNSQYRLTIEAPGAPTLDRVTYLSGTGATAYTFQLLQLNPGVNSDVVLSSGSYFTSSSNGNVLTASLELSAKTLGDYKQVSINGSNYKQITSKFELKPGDEIRVGNREDLTYLIYKIESPLNQVDGKMKIYVYPNLQPNLNLNQVLIRRYIPDANYIIVESSKLQANTNSGIIAPQYGTDQLKNTITRLTL